MILTENGIIAARDKLGRTPILLAKGPTAMPFHPKPVVSEFKNEMVYKIGRGEIVHITADGFNQLRKPNDKMQICAFCGCITAIRFVLRGCNVDEMRYYCGCEMGKNDKDMMRFLWEVFRFGVGMAGWLFCWSSNPLSSRYCEIYAYLVS